MDTLALPKEQEVSQSSLYETISADTHEEKVPEKK
jgi:hypothetical protein